MQHDSGLSKSAVHKVVQTALPPGMTCPAATHDLISACGVGAQHAQYTQSARSPAEPPFYRPCPRQSLCTSLHPKRRQCAPKAARRC